MKLLSHPNLVKLLGVCTTGEPVYIVMELMIHGKKLYMWMLLIPFIHPCQQCTVNQTIRICQSFLSNFRYLNRELNRTKLLGSYGFFPKATWFRLLNGNEDDYYDDNDQKRANYQGKYILVLDFLGINSTLLWSALKIFFIGVPKQRRLRFVQFLVSILRWFEELSSCPSPFCGSAGDTRGKV